VTANIFYIQPSSGTPIYRQLTDQIRRQCASGQLRPGDMLPSVRNLAGNLGVNPMTISRAYSLLEAEGLLVRRRGVGMQVVAAKTTPIRERIALLDPAIRALVHQAQELDVPEQSVLKALQRLLKKQEKPDD
jgi:GntR family transcriptional regulator